MQLNGVTFSYLSQDYSDIFFAMGGHTINITSEDVNWKIIGSSSEEPNCSLNVTNPSFKILDKYQFDLENQVDFVGFLMSFLRGATPDLVVKIQEDFIKKISEINMPDETKSGLMEVIRDNIRYAWVDDALSPIIGDTSIKEKDIGLLASKLCTTPFEVIGSIKFQGVVSNEFFIKN